MSLAIAIPAGVGAYTGRALTPVFKGTTLALPVGSLAYSPLAPTRFTGLRSFLGVGSVAVTGRLPGVQGLSGNAFYVATTGSDAANGQVGTPFRTLAHGIAALSAGDTLFVRGGTYNEVINSVPSGTSWANKVRIAAYSGETVTLRPTPAVATAANNGIVFLDGVYHYIEFDGINLDGSLLSGDAAVAVVSTNNGNDPHHIRFQNAEVIAGAIGGSGALLFGSHRRIGATGGNEVLNLTIHGGGRSGYNSYLGASYGVYLSGPNNLVDGCDIYDTSGAGIQIYADPGDSPDNNIIRNCRIHDITRTGTDLEVWGIIVDGHNCQIYNNVIYGIAVGAAQDSNAAILVGNNWNNNQIWNNTIYNCTNTGIYIGTGSGNEVKNNIVYQVTRSAFLDYGSGTVTATNLLVGDPLFKDVASNNFRLQSSSSALNAGTTIAGMAVDALGVMRPVGGAYDLGAYEYNETPIVTVPHATGARIVTDTFTGTAGTALTAHTGETGATWAAQFGSTGVHVLSDANRLRANSSGVSSVHYASAVPSSPNYDVEADFRVFSLIGGSYYAIAGRMDTVAMTFYFGQYNVTDARWDMYLFLNGVTTFLGQQVATLTVGQTYHVRLQLRGTQLTMEVDDVPIIQATDTTLATAGRAGLNVYGTATTNSTGIHVDNFTVTEA